MGEQDPPKGGSYPLFQAKEKVEEWEKQREQVVGPSIWQSKPAAIERPTSKSFGFKNSSPYTAHDAGPWDDHRSPSRRSRVFFFDNMVARPDLGALGFCMAFDAGEKDKETGKKSILFRILRSLNLHHSDSKSGLRPFRRLVSQKFAAAPDVLSNLARSYSYFLASTMRYDAFQRLGNPKVWRSIKRCQQVFPCWRGAHGQHHWVAGLM